MKGIESRDPMVYTHSMPALLSGRRERIRHMHRKAFGVGLLCILLVPASAHAWNQSEISWRTISTAHFQIQYREGLDGYAAQAAAAAEAVYGPITAFYGYEPAGKIYVNISDWEDEAQGSTYYYLNRIDITATPYDFWFRGTSSWFPDVIAHEFTHMVSVQSSFKYPRWIPSLYLQAVNFEKEKRPDVIYGYPNLQVSVPVPGELLPNWFAEGIAQYQCAGARHDIWDSHRDMLLRTALLNEKLLTFDEMGSFGKTSLGSELVYNQGFSLVRFIARRFGEAKLRELSSAFSSVRSWGFGGPCRRVLGLSGDELYRAWREDLETRYYPVAARVREREVDGEKAAGEGFMNLFPVPGRDGRELYYLSNRNRDYQDFDVVCRAGDGTIRKIAGSASSRLGITIDGGRLCFSRMTRANKHGYLRNDLYVYSFGPKKEKRLTRGLRATNPSWSPEGTRVACVVTDKGSQRIGVVDAGTGKTAFVTPSKDGREYMGLSWGARGILAARFDGSSTDIVLIDPTRGAETPLVATAADERDPCWSTDGSGFFYASDRTGIFNIYYHDLEGSTDVMVTNCIGGVFGPAPTGEDLVFAGYGAAGYEIRRLANWRARAVPIDAGIDNAELMRDRAAISVSPGALGADSSSATPVTTGWQGVGGAAGGVGKRFGLQYTGLCLYPRFMIFQGKPRIGLFLDSGDYLDRQSFFAGAAVSAEGEFDVNLSAETRQFKPTFGFEVYRSRTLYSFSAWDESGMKYNIDRRYDLWDAYFTCSMELAPTTPFSREEAVLQYNHGEYGLNDQIWELAKRRIFLGGEAWSYYHANELSFLGHYRSVRREIDADINPRSGRTIDIEITRAFDELFNGKFVFGFKPSYNKDGFGRYQIDYEEHVPLPLWRHALSLEVKGGAIDRSTINDFFYLYLGGRDGLRGYSYYSMGGTRMALGRLTYRFPVVRNVDRRVLGLYVGSIYAAAFAEAGKAWTADELDLNGNKKDVGFDVRLKGFTFYSYPIAASFEGAYGLNDVVYRDPFNEMPAIRYKKNWSYYGSVLFSF